ncbi:hypothetical protein ABVT39_022091 [Epinephelus coioides]
MDIIILQRGLLTLSVFVLWTSGLTDGSDVTQTDILWEKQGDSATIHCNQTKGGQYIQMYWYRQLPGETMKQIVYTSTASENHDFGDLNNGKFAATKPNAESGTFTVKNLEPEDKGLYFCAVPLTATVSSKHLLSSLRKLVNLLPEKSTVLTAYQIITEFSGLTDGSDVTQTDILWEKQGDSATIHCNQTKGPGYIQMYWYRQLPGETMKLIVFTSAARQDYDFGDTSKDKFAATKPNAESGTFTVKNLEPEDKGLYFCAVPLTATVSSKHLLSSLRKLVNLLPEKSTVLTAYQIITKFSGLTDGSDVTQTDILWEKQGDNATIHCNHTKAAQYNQMYWYRQLPGETMKLIVFTSTSKQDHDFGDFNNGKFAATKPNAESGTFTVKNLEPEEKGLYFCAVPLTATVSSKHLLSSLRKLVNLLPEKSTVLTAYQIITEFSGLTDGSGVTQTDILWEKQGDSATIHCNQTKGFQYDQMYWYRQLPGETMKLIVFTRSGNENHDFGDFDKDKFAATKPNAESGTFTVKNLEPEDKGLYFCAVSKHSDTDTFNS